MNRMSFSETIFLFLLALIIFGPKKLPEIARQVGKYMNEFKRASNEFKAQIEQEIAHLEVDKPTILKPSPPLEGTTSRTLTPAPVEALAAEEPVPAATETAVTEDEPLFATNPASTAEPSSANAPPAAAEVTSRNSQESHA